MPKLEILCTTMHQKDFSKLEQMNIQSHVVFANQADRWDTEEKRFAQYCAKMVTTATRGVSKNRNIAMDNITQGTEIAMFSDDDLWFYDNAQALVLEEFAKHPEADAIKFNLNCISERKISMRPIKNFHKADKKEVGGWGVWGMAIKTDILHQCGVRFNERFGPGTPNYCGEDTIFLQELLKKKVKLYASPVCIADIDQSVSSWFAGFDERYFITNGMVLQECFPVLCYGLALRGALRFSRRPNCQLPFGKILLSYLKGIRKNQIERKK